MNSDKPNNLKLVQLPSGKVIEVLYFPDQRSAAGAAHPSADAAPAPAQQPAPASRNPTDEELHLCPRCPGEFVYPVDWVEAGPNHWEVWRRCPDCEWADNSVFPQELVERFDVELDRGDDILLRNLQHLAHANMVEDIDRFLRALDADQILPEDF